MMCFEPCSTLVSLPAWLWPRLDAQCVACWGGQQSKGVNSSIAMRTIHFIKMLAVIQELLTVLFHKNAVYCPTSWVDIRREEPNHVVKATVIVKPAHGFRQTMKPLLSHVVKVEIGTLDLVNPYVDLSKRFFKRLSYDELTSVDHSLLQWQEDWLIVIVFSDL